MRNPCFSPCFWSSTLPPLPKAPHTQSDRSSCLAQQPDADGGPRPRRAMERALKVMGLGPDEDAGSSDSSRSVDGACASPRKPAAAPPANGQQLEDAPAAGQPVRPPRPQSLRACDAGPRRLAQFRVAHVLMSCQAAGESSASSFAGKESLSVSQWALSRVVSDACLLGCRLQTKA